jgi:dTDP-4-amino-4,6-dideoxygalactose transaminase
MRPMVAARAKRDIVEEFWDAGTLASCHARADAVDVGDFLAGFGRFLGASGKLIATPSGAAALQHLLAAVRRRDKDRVLLCSFNCKVVADAVHAAGLRIETFDLADRDGRIDWEIVGSHLGPRHAALVVPHFFGVPSDFRPASTAAAVAGALVVEDCAHTVGAKIGDRIAGTIGDAAIFSFNYDKPISLGGGGALLVNNPELWNLVPTMGPPLTPERDALELNDFLQYLARRRRLAPRRRPLDQAWHLVERSRPGRGWPRRRPLFPVSGVGPVRAALGLWQLEHYSAVAARRNSNADLFSLKTGLSWHVADGTTPSWLKQKTVHRDATSAHDIARGLRRQGLPVGTFNWALTIDEYLDRKPPPYSAYVARNAFDIPVHQNMLSQELETVCAAFA